MLFLGREQRFINLVKFYISRLYHFWRKNVQDNCFCTSKDVSQPVTYTCLKKYRNPFQSLYHLDPV